MKNVRCRNCNKEFDQRRSQDCPHCHFPAKKETPKAAEQPADPYPKHLPRMGMF